jgi:hypothetical protein
MPEEFMINEPEPRKNHSELIKILLAVIVTAILFGGAGYVLGNKNNIKPEAPAVPKAEVEEVVESSPIVESSTSPDTTATWKTYTNDTYGFSFKYPASWVEYTQEGNAGNDFAKYFKNPDVIATSEGENADPFAIQNILIRVYSKDSKDSLPDWLTAKYRGMGGELSDYNVGEKIELGGISGFVSNIGCCGGNDKSYVVEKNGQVFGLGTFSSEKYTMLAEIAKTFNFTK